MDRTAASMIPRVRERQGRRSKHFKTLVVCVLALAALVWVFHDIRIRPLLAAMAIANWRYVIIAIVFDILTYVLQGARWSLLLAPIGRFTTLKATQAIYAALFVNELMPLRPGELVRAFLAARWLSAPFNSVLPSIAIERLLDGVCLTVGIGLATMFVPLPHVLVGIGEALGIIILLASFAFLWIVFTGKSRGHPAERGSKAALADKVFHFISQFTWGLRAIGFSNRLYGAFGISWAMLACQVLALWFMMRACRIALPLFAAGIAFLIVRVGTMIPNAPANVGSFQFFTFVSLRTFGVEKTAAAAFSIVYFAALTLPLWAIGGLSIASAGLTRIHLEALALQKQRR